MTAYIVAGTKKWNRQVFEEIIWQFEGEWHFVDRPSQLSPDLLEYVNPRYLFFLHWSWIVPPTIFESYECVCFHMTDVPYGRGGSPLQNLIVRGHKETVVSALQMVDRLDAGPVYIKEYLSLAGSAEQIYIRASKQSAYMIREIIENNPVPQTQKGEVTVFKRRVPRESRIPGLENLDRLYDFIRMLDADGYPQAFFEFYGFRFEFSGAELGTDEVLANVTITKIKDGEE